MLGNDRQHSDVIRLLGNIGKRAEAERGHFKINRDLIGHLEERKRTEATRAEVRRMKVEEQRKSLRVQGEIQPVSDIRIMMLSYPVEAYVLSGEAEGPTEGATLQCTKNHWKVGNRKASVVHAEILLNGNTLEETKAEFVKSLSLCSPGPHAFGITVLMQAHFTLRMRQHLQTHVELLGEGVWDRCVVVFYSAGHLRSRRRVVEYIESEGLALQWLVQKCGYRCVVWRGPESKPDVLKKIDDMMVLHGGSHFQYAEGRTNQNTAAADWKAEVQLLVDWKEKLTRSMETPPQMPDGEKDETTSDYGTMSDTPSQAPSEDYGIGSLTSGTLERRREHKRSEGEKKGSSSVFISDTASEAPSEDYSRLKPPQKTTASEAPLRRLQRLKPPQKTTASEAPLRRLQRLKPPQKTTASEAPLRRLQRLKPPQKTTASEAPPEDYSI
ncbi:hypothetical protein ACEWY4_017222 [Coilia grayii]|uniref:AIG1-type G domain-containing protein n=1 Tax=Coilia grayii TaxID=363190 RepID=A0ABD1JJL0_9TELE